MVFSMGQFGCYDLSSVIPGTCPSVAAFSSYSCVFLCEKRAVFFRRKNRLSNVNHWSERFLSGLPITKEIAMKFINKASVLLLSLLAQKALAVTPEGVSLRAFTYHGTGCPFNYGMDAVFDESGQLVLRLPNMLAEWAPDFPKVHSRKNCVITLDLTVPSGWQYALEEFETSGYVALEAGLRAEVGVHYFFEGSPSQRLMGSYQGPLEDSFVMREFQSISGMQWSSCATSKKLNLNTMIRVLHADPEAHPAAKGWIELGSHWDVNPLKIRLAWKRCAL
jgi:hypothetical protein